MRLAIIALLVFVAAGMMGAMIGLAIGRKQFSIRQFLVLTALVGLFTALMGALGHR
jgi:hypothetical protein